MLRVRELRVDQRMLVRRRGVALECRRCPFEGRKKSPIRETFPEVCSPGVAVGSSGGRHQGPRSLARNQGPIYGSGHGRARRVAARTDAGRWPRGPRIAVGARHYLLGAIVLSSGGTPWVLAAGVVFWLACAVVIATGFLLTLHDLPEPRPGFWSMRWMIIHDAVGLKVRTGAPR